MSIESSYPRIKQRLVLLMAVATGLAVASNYYAQPLLQTLAETFGVDVRSAGLVVTVAQLSYAGGLLFIVPLGDRLERRGLIVGLYVACAAGLLVSAMSGSFPVLLLGTLVTGLCSVSAQVLVPYAATLAAPQERGRVVGTVMSGLLLGILLARTISGLLAGAGGWHTVYWVAAGLMLCVAVLLHRGLPRHPGNSSLSYPHLIGSVITLLRDEPVLRAKAVLGGLIFAGFSVFWTTLAFLLAGPDYGYGTAVIGLFGLIGAAGALAANLAGKLSDRGHGTLASWGGLVMLLASWLLMWAAPHSLWLLVVGVLLLDIAVQGVHINNQSVIYQLDASARNRITSAYMTCYFIGGALGSSIGTLAYARAGWPGVVMAGAVLALAALAWMGLTSKARARVRA